MTRVTWLGHATCMIEFKGGQTLLFDPWIDDNPSAPFKLEEVLQRKIDMVLVTHDHFDHFRDLQGVISSTSALLISTPEVGRKIQSVFSVETDRLLSMNLGGSTSVKGISVTMVQAFHSCETGLPCGYVVRHSSDVTIYYTGDTSLFADMELIGGLYQPDIVLLPIGGFFTMDPLQAAKALTLLKPKKAIPIHYRTFPLLEQNAEGFVGLAKQLAPEVEVIVLEPGQSFTFSP